MLAPVQMLVVLLGELCDAALLGLAGVPVAARCACTVACCNCCRALCHCERLHSTPPHRHALDIYTAVFCVAFLGEIGHQFNQDDAPSR